MSITDMFGRASGGRGVSWLAWTVRLCALVVVWACVSPVPADPGELSLSREQQASLLAQASAAFDRGKQIERTDPDAAAEAFREAAEKYRALIESGVRNGKLYYNLGNAELQRGRLGEAILNYRRAQELMPSDGRLRENLRFARSLCRSQIPERGESEFLRTLLFLHFDTSTKTRFWAAVSCWVAFWILLLVRMFLLRRPMGVAAAVLGVLWLTLGVSVAVDRRMADTRPEGVVMREEVIVRKGDGPTYDPKFEQPLHEGVEFVVLETRGDWLRIELADGNTGWIRGDQAKII